MQATVVTVRRTGTDGPWRLFASGSDLTLREQTTPLSDRSSGRAILGGTFDQAVADAERICRQNGFVFERPSGLLLP